MNQDFLDRISLISFIIGLANYGENVSQSDMQDAVNSAISEIHAHLQTQDDKIDKILEILEKNGGVENEKN